MDNGIERTIVQRMRVQFHDTKEGGKERGGKKERNEEQNDKDLFTNRSNGRRRVKTR